MAGFELSKWYLDCVTDSGRTLVAYTGVVRWGPMRLDYPGIRPVGEPRVTSSFAGALRSRRVHEEGRRHGDEQLFPTGLWENLPVGGGHGPRDSIEDLGKTTKSEVRRWGFAVPQMGAIADFTGEWPKSGRSLFPPLVSSASSLRGGF